MNRKNQLSQGGFSCPGKQEAAAEEKEPGKTQERPAPVVRQGIQEQRKALRRCGQPALTSARPAEGADSSLRIEGGED